MELYHAKWVLLFITTITCICTYYLVSLLLSFNISRMSVDSSLIFRQSTEVSFTLVPYRCVSSSQSWKRFVSSIVLLKSGSVETFFIENRSILHWPHEYENEDLKQCTKFNLVTHKSQPSCFSNSEFHWRRNILMLIYF